LLLLSILLYLITGASIALIDMRTDSFRKKLQEASYHQRGPLTKVFFILCALLWPVRVLMVFIVMLLGKEK
jgi:hypothetical protein